MAYNREKFKALVHYICWKVKDPSRLGAIKLNKVLWFSDLLTYLNLNRPVTGARYVKQQFGPVPAAIIPAVEDLKNDGVLAVRDIEYFGRPKREFFALKEPELSSFSAEEISIVDSVINDVCFKHTAKSISEFSHNKSWELAEIGEDLPFYTIFSARRGEITEDDMKWGKEHVARLTAA